MALLRLWPFDMRATCTRTSYSIHSITPSYTTRKSPQIHSLYGTTALHSTLGGRFDCAFFLSHMFFCLHVSFELFASFFYSLFSLCRLFQAQKPTRMFWRARMNKAVKGNPREKCLKIFHICNAKTWCGKVAQRKWNRSRFRIEFSLAFVPKNSLYK